MGLVQRSERMAATALMVTQMVQMTSMALMMILRRMMKIVMMILPDKDSEMPLVLKVIMLNIVSMQNHNKML